MKAVLAAMMLACASYPISACTENATPDPEPEKDNEAIEFAMSLGVGWNLGNNLDAHLDGEAVETGWGNGKATQKTFDALKAAGFSSVRIPVTWMGHIGKAPEYHIEKAWLDRVAEVAGYAKKAGLKCIINIHHDGFGAETDPAKKQNHWLDLAAAAKDETVNKAIMQKLTMVWMQIANRFVNEDEWLIFEVLNEIQDGKWGSGDNLTDGGAQYRTLNEWNQLCVDVIRATGGKNQTRYIGLPGYVCQPGLTIQHFELPYDETPNRLMVSVHLYDPWDYAGSGKYSEWGHTGTDVVPDNGGEREYIATLKNLSNRFLAAGVPVYVGEYGSVHRATAKAEEFRKYYLEYTCKALREYRMPVLYWDNGNRGTGAESFGIIDHSTGKFIGNGEEIARTMVNAWNSDDPEYTLLSIWKRAPRK
ncbi:MAG: glycoside hydrolase family 5 protein [Bacteroidales bacterium]|nr:glycoside hydrolase family 5 protein [Bacteroidales bacterium]